MSSRLRFAAVAILLCAAAGQARAGKTRREELVVDGVTRELFVYTPEGLGEGRHPAVLAFHGYQSDASGFRWIAKIDKAADVAGFIVIYPNAVDKSWNAGRGSGSTNRTTDDVAFAKALLEATAARPEVDPEHIYAMGFSNGAQMVATIVCLLDHSLAAAAMVAHSLNIPDCDPRARVPMLLIQGRKDPFVPFDGGGKSQLASHAFTVDFFRDVNNAVGPPEVVFDGSSIRCTQSVDCGGRERVLECTGERDGHTWPGGVVFQPELFGATNAELAGTEYVFAFFARHRGPPSPRGRKLTEPVAAVASGVTTQRRARGSTMAAAIEKPSAVKPRAASKPALASRPAASSAAIPTKAARTYRPEEEPVPGFMRAFEAAHKDAPRSASAAKAAAQPASKATSAQPASKGASAQPLSKSASAQPASKVTSAQPASKSAPAKAASAQPATTPAPQPAAPQAVAAKQVAAAPKPAPAPEPSRWVERTITLASGGTRRYFEPRDGFAAAQVIVLVFSGDAPDTVAAKLGVSRSPPGLGYVIVELELASAVDRVVEQVRERLGVSLAVSVVGLGAGGGVAQALYCERPELVSAVAMIWTAFSGPPCAPRPVPSLLLMQATREANGDAKTGMTSQGELLARWRNAVGVPLDAEPQSGPGYVCRGGRQPDGEQELRACRIETSDLASFDVMRLLAVFLDRHRGKPATFTIVHGR